MPNDFAFGLKESVPEQYGCRACAPCQGVQGDRVPLQAAPYSALTTPFSIRSLMLASS